MVVYVYVITERGLILHNISLPKLMSPRFLSIVSGLALVLAASTIGDGSSVEARTRKSVPKTSAKRVTTSKRASRSHKTAHASSHSKHHHHHVVAHAAPKPRYAYPLGLFLSRPPAFDTSRLDDQASEDIRDKFERGVADVYAARILVKAGIVKYHPLRGGIFYRREPVKYIVMHSTETGIPVPAKNVIESWSSMGLRHPGAQYVVDRDGTIYQAVDPDLATVHVNIFKTLPGINNDNSIGIEMNHTGSQDYPRAQRQAVTRLVGYLKHRYNIQAGNIITHRYAQQGDHTDPVNFNFDDFLATIDSFTSKAIAYRVKSVKDDAKQWKKTAEPAANVYLKPHTQDQNNAIETKTEPQNVPESNSMDPKLESPTDKVNQADPVEIIKPADDKMPEQSRRPISPSPFLPAPTTSAFKPATQQLVRIPVDANGNILEYAQPGANAPSKTGVAAAEDRRSKWLKPYPGL